MAVPVKTSKTLKSMGFSFNPRETANLAEPQNLLREANGRAMVLGTNAAKKFATLAELQPVQMPPRNLIVFFSCFWGSAGAVLRIAGAVLRSRCFFIKDCWYKI